MTFELFSPKLQKLIEKKGFIEPTEPQKVGIPEIMQGNNVLILAPTGSGKTETSCLPLFDKISKNKDKPIAMLYINPLRSLSRDILDRMFWWGDKLDIEVAVRYGDTSQQERKSQSEKPPECLITTPETLSAILIGKNFRKHLSNVKYVVIDEVHEIVENKRGIQLSLLLERLRRIAGNFQVIGISATVGDPKKVADFLSKKTKIIRAETAKQYDIKVEMPLPGADHKKISEELFIGDNTTARLMRLRDIINSHKSVLTFTNTRETAEILSSRFRAIDKELKQEVHHGSLSKESRIASEQKFKEEKIKALIATSSLELGIDIGSIDLVVQYLSPRQVSKLIQRVGRSGHRVGGKSMGIVITGEEDVFESSIIAKKAIKKEIEDVHIHELAADVLASQIVGMALEDYDISSDIIFNVVKNSYPYRNLTKNDFLNIIRFLGNIHVLWLDPVKKTGKNDVDEYKLRRSKKSWEYYYENLSTIPDTRQMKIISIVENEPIGTLDEAFIAEHGEIGNTFVVKGRAWKILQMEAGRVLVEPVDDIESAIPAWEGELIPVPFSVAQEVGALRALIKEKINDKFLSADIMDIYNIDKNSVNKMVELIKKQQKFFVPDNENFLLETYKDFIILHSCCGTLINDTIGRYVSAVLTAETGVAVNMKTDPYRIIFQTTAKPGDIKRILESSDRLNDTLELALERSSLFKHRFLHVARRFGVLSKGAKYDRLGITKIISQYVGTPVYAETTREILHEKMDIKNAEKILDKIKNREIKIHLMTGLSELGEMGLARQFSEVMKPRMPEKEIFEAFRKRLMHTTLRLVCTNCADYSIVSEVRSLDDQPVCPKCNSGMIGLFGKFKRQPLVILKKFKSKKSLTNEEKKELENIKRSASLMITYGKKYAFVQAGHGIGVETAARVLAKMPKDEEQLLKYIFEAEKNYAKTRIYWKA